MSPPPAKLLAGYLGGSVVAKAAWVGIGEAWRGYLDWAACYYGVLVAEQMQPAPSAMQATGSAGDHSTEEGVGVVFWAQDGRRFADA